MIEYEFALFLDGEFIAGGSSYSLEEVKTEAQHYNMLYSLDGKTEIKYYERKEIFV